jgi:hypothetical protein
MMYTLRNGYSVHTTDQGVGTEFVTKNPAGDVISTVVHSATEAARLVRDLRIGERLNMGR